MHSFMLMSGYCSCWLLFLYLTYCCWWLCASYLIVGWLVVSNMNFISIIYGMSSFPLTNSIIFQDGYCTTNQLVIGFFFTFPCRWSLRWGQCICFFGWGGADCSAAMCCNGRGDCPIPGGEINLDYMEMMIFWFNNMTGWWFGTWMDYFPFS